MKLLLKYLFFLLSLIIVSCNAITRESPQIDAKAELLKILEKHGLSEEYLVKDFDEIDEKNIDLSLLDKKLAEVAPVILKMEAHNEFIKKVTKLSKSFSDKRNQPNFSEKNIKDYDRFIDEFAQISKNYNKPGSRTSLTEYYEYTYYEKIYNIFNSYKQYFKQEDLIELNIILKSVKNQVQTDEVPRQ